MSQGEREFEEKFARVFNQQVNEFVNAIEEVRNIYDADSYTQEVADDALELYNIRNFYRKVQSEEEIKPEEILRIIKARKYAKDNNKRFLEEEIKEAEDRYYEDVPPIPENVEEVLEKNPISIEEAEKRLNVWVEIIEQDMGYSEKQVKFYMKQLERQVLS